MEVAVTAKSLHLGKVLKLLMLEDAKLISELRKELRTERDKLLKKATVRRPLL